MMITLHRCLAVLIAVLVLGQAALAGRFLFVDHDAVDIHQIVANILSVLVVADVAFVVLKRREWTNQTLILTPLLAILVIVQTGVGYMGRDSDNALALHVPLGVFIFGVTAVVAIAAFSDRSMRQQTAKQSDV